MPGSALNISWSSYARADIVRIVQYWIEHRPEVVPPIAAAIQQRVRWIADGRAWLGSRVEGLDRGYRCYFEPCYGYKIFYRVEGSPPIAIKIITIRHSRRQPLRPATLKRYS